VTEPVPLDAELVYEEFHRVVNMTSQELGAWLSTDTGADPALAELGRDVAEILGKRKVDLTEGDAAIMERAADFVAERLGSPPPEGTEDVAWRRSLMTVGHDPLRSP
jgi:hypothetical protein